MRLPPPPVTNAYGTTRDPMNTSHPRPLLQGSGILLLALISTAGCGHQVVGWPDSGCPEDTGCGQDTSTTDTSMFLDTTAPTVRWTIPEDGATNVAANAAIFGIFDETMDPLSLTTSTFTLDDGAVAGVVTQFGATTVFYPSEDLAPFTEYRGTLTVGARDVAGNPLATDYRWTFTTGSDVDLAAPHVIFTNPTNGATGVALDAPVNATFNEDMDPLRITPTTFLVARADGQEVTGTVAYDGPTLTATFAADDLLEANTSYTATVTTGIRDLAGNALSLDYVWAFTTGVSPSIWVPVDLGSLSSFVAVSGAGLTNSNSGGTTTLTGDVGLYPTATCLGDGAPCTATNPIIAGTLYAADSGGIAEQAKIDLTAAYVDAMGRPPGTLVDDLSGMVLAPGVYTSDSAMSIAVGGTVTLDAEGDPDAVWIFQVGSSLTVNNDAQVILVNGARSSNVFWAAFASSTLGSNVSFQGSVLAGASNSVGTGSSVVGRLLCTTGEITLLSNSITLPPF